VGAVCAQRKIGGNFVKGVDQNFPLFFTGQSTPLTRSPKWGRGLTQKWERELEPKTGGTCARFRLQIWGIEATGLHDRATARSLSPSLAVKAS